MKLKVDFKSIKQHLHKTRVIMSAPVNYSPQKKIKLEKKSNDDEYWRSKYMRSFDEKDVGITEFIGHHNSFTGIIKDRYEDFVVHEITKTGEIVRLTDLSVPPLFTAPIIDIHDVLDDDVIKEIQKISYDLIKLKTENEISLKTPSVSNVNTNDGNSVAIANKFQTGSGFVKINVTNKEKHERGTIHKAIRDHFPNVESTTIDENNEKWIRICRLKYGGRRMTWVSDKGDYVHFSLYKENVETQYAINLIASKLHVSPKNITYAGTKDKRAITTQRVCIWKVTPNKLVSAVESLRNIKIGNFCFEDKPLDLGDLSGNQFDIVLRDVVYDSKNDVENALTSVNDNGFINYYGMQRFGFNFDKPQSVGLLILQHKWKEVVEALLKPKAKDMSPKQPNLMSFNQCMEMWQNTRDARKVYKNLSFKSSLEGMLLHGLTKVAPNDYHGALCTGLHRNHRLFPLHCLQSYLWNCIVSYRIRTYGTNVVIGDLLIKNLCTDNEDLDFVTNIEDSDEKDINRDIYYADERNIEKLSIYDVVIPMIGTSTLLPKNSTADYINSLLAKEGITIDMYRSLPKQWTNSGKYRKLLAKPSNLSWKWIRYTDPNQPLLEKEVDKHIQTKCNSDLIGDGLEQMKSLPIKIIEHNTEQNDSSISVTNEQYFEEKLAIILSFSLPTSCYATIMLREITKTEPTDLEIKPWLSRVGARI